MEPEGTIVYCNHKKCLHLKFFEDGPRHPPSLNRPQDWDEGYVGYCTKKIIGIKVRVIETKSPSGADMRYTIPECRMYACGTDWRIHLPYPDQIAQRGGRLLGSQEHDSSR